MYKIGNWWTYQNQDSTKKDSIFFTQFYDAIGRNNTDNPCITWQLRYGTMGSQYLCYNDTHPYFSYDNPYEGQEVVSTYVQLSSATSDEYLMAYSDKQIVSLIPTYTQKNKTYYNVFKSGHNKYFAPNIGLIRWETMTDTFTLKKYYIQ